MPACYKVCAVMLAGYLAAFLLHIGVRRWNVPSWELESAPPWFEPALFTREVQESIDITLKDIENLARWETKHLFANEIFRLGEEIRQPKCKARYYMIGDKYVSRSKWLRWFWKLNLGIVDLRNTTRTKISWPRPQFPQPKCKAQYYTIDGKPVSRSEFMEWWRWWGPVPSDWNWNSTGTL